MEASAALSVEQRRYAEAEVLIQQELALLRSVLEPTQPGYLKVTAVIPYLADLYIKQGKMTEAETLLQQELATLRSVLEPADYQVMTMSEHLVDIYMRRDKRAEAETLLRQLIDLRQQSLDTDAEEGVPIARNLLPLAQVLVTKGAHEEAEVCYRRALAIVDKYEMREGALLLKLLMSYASFLLMMDRDEEAEQLMARADAVYEEVQGHNAYWEGLSHYLNEGEILGDNPSDSPS